MNNFGPVLSIVVPVSRMAGRFNELSSWLNDTEDIRIEVVIVHDVADDATEQELQLLLAAARIKQIKCISGQFGSPGNARNRGFAETVGKWVMFVDSDDVLDVQNVMAAILNEKRNLEAIVGRYLTYDRMSSKLRSSEPWGSCFEQLAFNPGIWRIVFLRSAIENLAFTNLLMAEDQIYLAQFDPRQRNIAFVDDIFYTYYVGDSRQATQNSKSLADLSKAMKLTASLIWSSSVDQFQFLGILINRQLITSLKRAPFVAKLKSIIFYIRLIFCLGPRRAALMLKELFTIIISYVRLSNAS